MYGETQVADRQEGGSRETEKTAALLRSLPATVPHERSPKTHPLALTLPSLTPPLALPPTHMAISANHQPRTNHCPRHIAPLITHLLPPSPTRRAMGMMTRLIMPSRKLA